MNEPIETELAKQRKATLDLIAARCAEALRVVERQAGRSGVSVPNPATQAAPVVRRTQAQS